MVSFFDCWDASVPSFREDAMTNYCTGDLIDIYEVYSMNESSR